MADELLSQAELDTLLRNSAQGLAPKVRDSAGHPVPAPHASRFREGDPAQLSQEDALRRRLAPHRGVEPPERLGEEPMAAIRSLHENFCRGSTAALSVLLRSAAELKLVSDEQTTYGQFIARLANPTCASVVRAGALSACWLVEISPPVFYAMIDRMLGGGREPSIVARRPLTDIELRLAARIMRLLLEELQKAWRHVAALELALDRVESNPRLALVAPSQEGVVLVGFDAKIGEVRGALTLCIPSGSLAPVASTLGIAATSRGGPAASRPAPSPRDKPQTGQEVEIVVHLAETTIAAQDLANLRIGDVIATETDTRSPMTVCVDGTAAFLGHPGAIDGRKAIRIDRAAPGPDARAESA